MLRDTHLGSDTFSRSRKSAMVSLMKEVPQLCSVVALCSIVVPPCLSQTCPGSGSASAAHMARTLNSHSTSFAVMPPIRVPEMIKLNGKLKN